MTQASAKDKLADLNKRLKQLQSTPKFSQQRGRNPSNPYNTRSSKSPQKRTRSSEPRLLAGLPPPSRRARSQQRHHQTIDCFNNPLDRVNQPIGSDQNPEEEYTPPFPDLDQVPQLATSSNTADLAQHLPFRRVSDTEIQQFIHTMATEQVIRKILKETFGDFGKKVDAAGAPIVNAAGNEVAPAPSLLDRLGNMKKKAEVAKPPGPFTFSGSMDQNPKLWKDTVTDYFEYAGTSAADQKRLIKMYLSGPALVWARAKNSADIGTFWTDFEAEYINGPRKYITQQITLSRKQGDNEEAEDYISDLVSKADMLGWDNDRTLQHLMAGLNDAYKPHVIMQNPTNLNDAIALIRRAKNAGLVVNKTPQLSAIQNSLSEILSQVKLEKEEKKVAAVDLEPQGQKPYQSSPEQPTYYREPYQKPYRSNNFTPRRFGYQSNGYRYGQNPRRFDSTPNIIINTTTPPPRQDKFQGGFQGRNANQTDACFECGRMGHWASRCPTKRNPGYFGGRINTIMQQPRLAGRSGNPTFQRRRGPTQPRQQYGFRQNQSGFAYRGRPLMKRGNQGN